MSRRKTPYRVQVLNRQRQFRVQAEFISSFCAETLQALGHFPCALTVVLIDNRTMERLNCSYREHSYPTDVLSFAYGCEEEEELPYLGDIVIAPEVADANARRWRVSLDKEVRKLLIHGLLHLLGHDHETDSGEMNRLQARLQRRRYFHSSVPVLIAGKQRRDSKQKVDANVKERG